MLIDQEQPRTPTDQLEDSGTLAGALARFVKLTALLPPTNERVQWSARAVLSQVSRTLEERLVVVLNLGLGNLTVDGQAEDSEYDPSLRWFVDHLERSGVAAIELRPTVSHASLLAFGKRLVENGNNRRSEVLFDDLWPESYPGIKLIERRYDGAFPVGADGQDGARTRWRTASRQGRMLAELLESKPELTHKLMRLQALIDQADAQAGPTEGRKQVDLIGRIVNLFPAEAMADPSRITELADSLLSHLAQEIERPGTGKLVARDMSVNHMLLRLGRKFFFREQPAQQQEGKAKQLGQRNWKQKTDQSIEELLCDIEQLEEGERVELEERQASERERVGVLLQFLALTRDEDLADRLVHLIATALSDTGSDCESFVLEFVRRARARFALHRQGSVLDRLAALLADPRLESLAAESKLFEVEQMIELFPTVFVPFLDSLDPEDSSGRQRLESVCRAVGPERLLGSSAELAKAGGLGHNGRAGKLLAQPCLATLPFLHLILEDQPALTAEVALALRGLKLDLPEAEPLRLFEDVRALPREYLSKLAASGGSHAEELTRVASRLLVRIAVEADWPQEKRQFAISLLGVVQSELARETLETLARGRRFLVLPTECAEIRETARHALARYGREGE